MDGKAPETQEQQAVRIEFAQREHDRVDRATVAMFPAVVSFAVEALKAAALVNGGSAAAMLAFIGTGRQPVTDDTIFGLKLFGYGLLAAVFATAASYICQLFYLREMQTSSHVLEHPFVLPTPVSQRASRTAISLHVLGVVLAVVAYGCAVGGLLYVAASLVPLPAKT